MRIGVLFDVILYRKQREHVEPITHTIVITYPSMSRATHQQHRLGVLTCISSLLEVKKQSYPTLEVKMY